MSGRGVFVWPWQQTRVYVLMAAGGTNGLPLNMLSVSHSISDHIFQYHFQCSLGSTSTIVSLKINCCSRIFHWFHWWIAKKIWKLQLMNRTGFNFISFSFLLPISFSPWSWQSLACRDFYSLVLCPEIWPHHSRPICGRHLAVPLLDMGILKLTKSM